MQLTSERHKKQLKNSSFWVDFSSSCVHFGLKKFMPKSLPEISKQIRSEDIREVLEKNYTSIAPVWVPAQMTWMNNVYRTFHDYEKFMIVMHLLMKTYESYSKNFVKLNYKEFFDQIEIEIEKINVMEISKALNLAKETTRRKINELEELGAIKRVNKKFIIDRNDRKCDIFFNVSSGFILGQAFLSIKIFLLLFLIALNSTNSLIFLLVVSFGMLSALDISFTLSVSTSISF